MRSGTMYTLHTDELSLTDEILTFCASGRFGVREAVAAAMISRNEAKRGVGGEHEWADQPAPTGPAHLALSTVPPADGEARGQP